MTNSYQPPKATSVSDHAVVDDMLYGSYIYSLSVNDLPSHGSISNYYTWNKKDQDKISGYLCITPDYKISCKVKPHPKHLHNMKKFFGWTWENV